MDNDQIVSRMNTYLHTSSNVLTEWLGKLLPRASEDWWEECVLDKLSYNQRETARERGFTLQLCCVLLINLGMLCAMSHFFRQGRENVFAT